MDILTLSSLHILLIDDSAAWRKAIGTIVQKQVGSQNISEACDGLEAIDLASKLQPDLILLDLNLPGLNGIAACQRIIQHRPDAKILFISQQTDSELVDAAFNSGALGYVVKSRVHTELLLAIETVLERRYFVGKGVSAELLDVVAGCGKTPTGSRAW